MAWPPPVLPINITDATAQQATHPDLHNKTSQAVNDIVERLQARSLLGMEVLSGVAQSGEVGCPATGIFDAVVVNLGAAPWSVRVHAHADVYFGNGTGWINGKADLFRFVDAVAAVTSPVQQAIAGAWEMASLDWSWAVGAGQNMSLKARYTCVQVEPTKNTGWYDARVSYSVITA